MANHVLIATPLHLVQTVAELIANDEGPGAAAAPVEVQAEPELLNGWTEKTLRQHYRDSSEKMRAFLVFLAEHADEEVTTHAAAQAVGSKDWNSIAGMLGAAQRRAKNHFGRESGPWSRRWAADDQARVRMPERVAEVVLSEAEAQGDRRKELQVGQSARNTNDSA